VFHAPGELEHPPTPTVAAGGAAAAEAVAVSICKAQPQAKAAVPKKVKAKRSGGPKWLMVMLIGIQGSGKSTFSTQLCAADPNWTLISQDACGGSRAATERQLGIAMRQKRRILLDRYNYEAEDRKQWMKLAMVQPRDVAVSFFHTPVEMCKYRVMVQSHPTIPFGRGGGIVEGTHKKLQPPTQREGFGEVICVSDAAQANRLLEAWGGLSRSLAAGKWQQNS